MKIVISQPMNGMSNDQIKKNRGEVVKDLEAEGHEILDS